MSNYLIILSNLFEIGSMIVKKNLKLVDDIAKFFADIVFILPNATAPAPNINYYY